MSLAMTRVRLIAVPELCHVKLFFGHTHYEEIPSGQQRYVYFLPNSIFSTIRWHGNQYGTTLTQLSIFRAASPYEIAARTEDVDPGADILLRITGRVKIAPVLSRIRQIQLLGLDLADVSPHYWRTVQNRIIARQPLPVYTCEEHEAYERRTRMSM